jgi:hypothetical protein
VTTAPKRPRLRSAISSAGIAAIVETVAIVGTVTIVVASDLIAMDGDIDGTVDAAGVVVAAVVVAAGVAAGVAVVAVVAAQLSEGRLVGRRNRNAVRSF